ncbi:MAG TPA: hypothetical protein VG942_14825 [Hyphomonadaceae bacterium]|nr:hypothetical protein [Hyphomonadaceae bacterium]
MSVTATDIAIYLGVGIAAVAIFIGLRLAAGRMGKADPAMVRADFSTLPGFSPGETLIHLGSAISYDPVRNHVAIWEKMGGARLVDPSGVAAWRSGTDPAPPTNEATGVVELYARPGDRRPFFKVGISNAIDAPRWRDRLQAAFGGDKERPAAQDA